MSSSLIKAFRSHGLSFDLGSDHHVPLDTDPYQYTKRILDAKKSDVLFLLWDTFDAEHGEDTSSLNTIVLQKLAQHYSHVIFTPGNHCLRGRSSPWKSFELPNNVYMPLDHPISLTISGTRILVWNIFYDMDFINPTLLWYNWGDIKKFYTNETNDGKFLLKWDFSSFVAMAERMRSMIYSESPHIIATHTLPSPSGVLFKVVEITQEMEEYSRIYGMRFVVDLEQDERGVAALLRKWHHDATADWFRRYWNYKSYIMGSNLFNVPLQNNITALYGHTHRSANIKITLGEKILRLVSHQVLY